MTSMIYKSALRGVSQTYRANNRLLNQIEFETLYGKEKPFLYHKFYNLTTQSLDLLLNRKADQGQDISAASQYACSILIYIEAPFERKSNIYCKGSTVDTMNFEHLLPNHPDLDEIWVRACPPEAESGFP